MRAACSGSSPVPMTTDPRASSGWTATAWSSTDSGVSSSTQSRAPGCGVAGAPWTSAHGDRDPLHEQRRRPARVRLRAELVGMGAHLDADVDDPGGHATGDGQAERIARAGQHLVCVRVRAGGDRREALGPTIRTSTGAPVPARRSRPTVAPTDSAAITHTGSCQCRGRSTLTTAPGGSPSPSRSIEAALATALATLATDSSIRESGPS